MELPKVTLVSCWILCSIATLSQAVPLPELWGDESIPQNYIISSDEYESDSDQPATFLVIPVQNPGFEYDNIVWKRFIEKCFDVPLELNDFKECLMEFESLYNIQLKK